MENNMQRMNFNTFESDQNDLTNHTINEDCWRDIKVIDVGPTWMTYKQLMERTANLKDTRE